jgi:hypothetical protein
MRRRYFRKTRQSRLAGTRRTRGNASCFGGIKFQGLENAIDGASDFAQIGAVDFDGDDVCAMRR